jgi:hypothetical protein
MTEKEVYKMLKTINLPLAYDHFEESKAPKLPYLVYRYPHTNNFAADGKVHTKVNALDIELYTESKDLATERKIEAVLDECGIFYEKTETFITSEKMYQILYETEVLIDG